MARLFHNLHNAVKRHSMLAVGKCRIKVGIKCAGGSIGVALNAGYLHKAAHGVASHAEVMLKSHFGCIFHLRRASAKKLVCCTGSHGASYTHFALTSYFGTCYGGVLFHDIAYQSGGGECPKYSGLGKIAAFLEMIKYGRNHSARTAGGCSDNLTSAGIFFAYGQSVGKYEAA